MSEVTPKHGNVSYPGFPVNQTYMPPAKYAVDDPRESPPDPRSTVRWILLRIAYDILKARHPNRSTNDPYRNWAEHYGRECDTVREAREDVQQRRVMRGWSWRQANLAREAKVAEHLLP